MANDCNTNWSASVRKTFGDVAPLTDVLESAFVYLLEIIM